MTVKADDGVDALDDADPGYAVPVARIEEEEGRVAVGTASEDEMPDDCVDSDGTEETDDAAVMAAELTGVEEAPLCGVGTEEGVADVEEE